MFRSAKVIAVLGCVSAVAACEEVPPSGPTVMALPSVGKNLTTFEQEDGQCRALAAAKIGNVSSGNAGTQAAVGSATVGTVLGAAAGSTVGAAAGNPGAGAAVGGAVGLAGDLQTRYDIAYTQCMYSYGDTVQSAPRGGYGDYANVGYPYYGYPYYGYPWYDWAGPGFFGGGVFVFQRGHVFHHGFHRFHGGAHGRFRSGFHGGFRGGGGFHR
jgi:hypothetical protein